MPRSKEQLLKTVVDAGVIAVIRAPSAEILIPLAEALLAGGVAAIEVTMACVPLTNDRRASARSAPKIRASNASYLARAASS